MTEATSIVLFKCQEDSQVRKTMENCIGFNIGSTVSSWRSFRYSIVLWGQGSTVLIMKISLSIQIISQGTKQALQACEEGEGEISKSYLIAKRIQGCKSLNSSEFFIGQDGSENRKGGKVQKLCLMFTPAQNLLSGWRLWTKAFVSARHY